jgi:hypothetical protein
MCSVTHVLCGTRAGPWKNKNTTCCSRQAFWRAVAGAAAGRGQIDPRWGGCAPVTGTHSAHARTCTPPHHTLLLGTSHARSLTGSRTAGLRPRPNRRMPVQVPATTLARADIKVDLIEHGHPGVDDRRFNQLSIRSHALPTSSGSSPCDRGVAAGSTSRWRASSAAHDDRLALRLGWL